MRQQISVFTIEGDYDAALPYAQDVLALILMTSWRAGLSRLLPSVVVTGTRRKRCPAVIQTRLDEFIASVANTAVMTRVGDIETALAERGQASTKKASGPWVTTPGV